MHNTEGKIYEKIGFGIDCIFDYLVDVLAVRADRERPDRWERQWTTGCKIRPQGLQFRLSEGVEGAETREKQPLAEDRSAVGRRCRKSARPPSRRSNPTPTIRPILQSGSARLPAPKTGNKFRSNFRRTSSELCRMSMVARPTLEVDAFFARRRNPACARSERHIFAADGRRYLAGRSREICAGRTDAAGRRPLALAGNENADVRYGQAFSDGDEIHGTRSRRNKVGDRPGSAKRFRLDIHHAAAKGRADDPARADRRGAMR